MCTTNVTNKEILCDRCRYWCHPNCAWLSDDEYSILGDSLDTCYCPACYLPSLGSSLLRVYLMTTQTQPSFVSIIHLNTRSLLPSTEDILCSILDSNPIDILTLSETWLDDTISNSEISLPGYSFIRRDQNRNGGGITIYVVDTTQLNMFPNLTSS